MIRRFELARGKQSLLVVVLALAVIGCDFGDESTASNLDVNADELPDCWGAIPATKVGDSATACVIHGFFGLSYPGEAYEGERS